MNFIGIVFQLLSALPAMIQEAELAFSGKPGLGPQKKQFVLDATAAIIGIVNATGKVSIDDAQQKAVLTAASTVTDAVVAGLNAAGTFKK